MGCWNNLICSVTKAIKYCDTEERLYGAQLINLALNLSVFLLQISLRSCSFNNFSSFSNTFSHVISIHLDILKGQAHDLNIWITLKIFGETDIASYGLCGRLFTNFSLKWPLMMTYHFFHPSSFCFASIS